MVRGKSCLVDVKVQRAMRISCSTLLVSSEPVHIRITSIYATSLMSIGGV